ncbi:MAG: GLPGLI family protein [Flavobacterium sp.]|uniref:GLPGLI family protein n=1 Tax=Flavobacterium sp. TaxID=239 RepID=UPI0025C12898|nr:GLPGLI family protein [Flavobacterium sp.]MCK6607605.1 GLPGLI family protein [Flavobacterium sp.]
MLQKLILLLLFTCSLQAQKNSVSVNYSLHIGFDEGFSKNDVLKDYYALAQKGAKAVKFKLEANKSVSYFTMEDLIKNEEVDFAVSFSEASTSYFIDIEQDKKTRYESGYFGEYMMEYQEITNWELENETKQIGSYLCYKATSEQIVVNPKTTFKHPIVAWYCPSIPFNVGPKGYSGLPGLILELQVRNITWGATKIELSKENKIIEKPKKGKLITEEEFKKIIASPPMLGN